uniref:Ficolin 3 n=1 Tax=Suricata suricatta TaxID=37032 RepID=A0A673UKL9_SURSU
MGLLWTPLPLLLLLAGKPDCLRSQDYPSCPGKPRELEARVVLLPSCPGAPGSPGEKGAAGQPGPPGKMGSKGEPGPRNCQKLLSQGATLSGQEHLCLLEGRALPVFCDMDTKEGGWLVSVRETPPGHRGWPSRHFFLLAPRGSQSPLELRHSLSSFTDQRHRFKGARHGARLQGASVPSLAGDSLSFHNGKSFTTYDADHDPNKSNCAVTVHGAWWYGTRYRSNLNGRCARSEATAHKYGIAWASGRGAGLPYRKFRMMLC